MSYKTEAALEYAARITALGFRVYLAKSGEYGFITDEAGERVLSFSFNDQGSLGGNYGPPSSESGTGWRMNGGPESLRTAEDVKRALYSLPDFNTGKGWRYLSTVEQYLAQYGRSSGFVEFKEAGQ